MEFGCNGPSIGSWQNEHHNNNTPIQFLVLIPNKTVTIFSPGLTVLSLFRVLDIWTAAVACYSPQGHAVRVLWADSRIGKHLPDLDLPAAPPRVARTDRGQEGAFWHLVVVERLSTCGGADLNHGRVCNDEKVVIRIRFLMLLGF